MIKILAIIGAIFIVSRIFRTKGKPIISVGTSVVYKTDYDTRDIGTIKQVSGGSFFLISPVTDPKRRIAVHISQIVMIND